MTGKADLHVVIMAGGVGTRFWPLSRRKTPKQFLPIATGRTMFEETVGRVLPLVPEAKVLTVANAAQTRSIRRLAPSLPAANLIVEPRGKNTAPSLILATAQVYLRNPEAVVAVLPSDHHITRPEVFLRKLRAAAEAAVGGESLVTFGIRPTFPSTGYGYIHFSRRGVKRHRGEAFFPVLAFTEKPGLPAARRFLRRGGYAWNSGMFVWRASVFARKLERHAPDFFRFWGPTLSALKSRSRSALAKVFDAIPALSIDYALMEKAEGTLTSEGDFGWSDVGAWSALADIWPRDGEGNAVKGEAVVLDSGRNVVYNPGKMTALVGVRDLVVVETPDALLVCRKDRDQEVKKILEALAKRGKSRVL
jgi:mannose-1-phosphate guanylyltransferase